MRQLNRDRRWRRFSKRHPEIAQRIIDVATQKVFESEEEDSIDDICQKTETEVKGSIIVSIVLGVVIKLAVEYIYAWLKDRINKEEENNETS